MNPVCFQSVVRMQTFYESIKDSYSNCLYDNGTIGSSSITIDLNSALDANTTYKAKVLKEGLDGSRKLKDASDGSGTQLSSDYEFSFTTGS